MTVTGWSQIIVLVAVLTLLAPLLGGYMARVYQQDRIGLAYVLGPLQRLLYRALRVDESEEQSWVQYARSLLLFSAASWLALYVVLRTQPFGRMVGRRRQGWALYSAMLAMFIGGAATMYAAETHGTPAQHAAGLRTHVVAGSVGGNMEGKEQRVGPAGSALFVASGTASRDGAVNSGVESYTGLGAGVAMANMMTGEVIFGGPGPGLHGMISLVVLAVFLAGLMVGRTPEYLGKQIQAREVKLATIATVFVPLLVLGLAAVAVAAPVGRHSILAHGPQGLAESVYAYLSQAQNNGSAMAGYTGFVRPIAGNLGSHGIAFADLAGDVVMTLGRFVPILAMLALAGSLGPRRVAPPGLGTLRTDTPTFVIYLVGSVVIVAVLTFLTALVLAPFAQALSSRMLG
ncbi:MAG: potassium-transporting ATPase subunit KdpA [Solirubrobacteraceae bacterium]